MRHSYWITFAIITVLLNVHTKADTALPKNFHLSRDLAEIVSDVYEESATFRPQCDRLEQARNVSIRVRFDVNLPSTCRALTIIRRTRGALCADVHVPPGARLVELLAHEFEHIIEQLDGMNLRLLSKRRDSGVREVAVDIFETDRAQRTGRLVADEVRARREAHPSAD